MLPTPPSTPKSLPNHVFVDFENVQEIDLAIIGRKETTFTLLVGAAQKKLDAALVERLLECSSSVQLIRLTSSGKNALDFALAYYAGRISASDPGSYIHIISGDSGFDPLIEHLRARGVKARRHKDFSSLTFSCPSPESKPAAEEEPQARALEHLRRNANNRPKKKTTLVSNLAALFAHKLPEQDIFSLVGRLAHAGHLTIGAKESITYHLAK